MTVSIKAQLSGKSEQEIARETLLKDYLSGDSVTVYTVLRRVSASGMTRAISLKVAESSSIYDITYLAAQALGEKVAEVNGHNVIKVRGCGMDMGFHLVYGLSSVLFHGQERAGYKLSHRWL